MNFRRISVVMVVVALALAGIVRADAFDPKQVPATAKWLVHVDLDALRGTQIGQAIHQKLQNDSHFLQHMGQLKAITGIGSVEDFHDITVYGAASGDAAAVVMVHAAADRERILTMLQTNPAYSDIPYHNHSIYTWQDGQKTQYGAFADQDMTIIGRTQEAVQTALDTLDGTGQALDAKSTMGGGAPKGALAYVAGRDLASLRKLGEAKQPAMEHVDSVGIALSEDAPNALLNGTVLAKTPAAAKQLQSIFEGIKSFVTLNANGENADDNVKLLAKALENLKVDVNGQNVSVTLPVDLDVVRQFIDMVDKKRQADQQQQQ